MIATEKTPIQLPLIHIVETDDLYLQELQDVLWFPVLC